MRALLLALLPALLAGCLAAAPAPVDPSGALPGYAAARSLLAGVPCEAPVGPGTSGNLLDLAHVPYEDGGAGEMDVFGNLALVARMRPAGFRVMDLSDPQAPATVSVFGVEDGYAADVKWLPDGRGALIGRSDGKIHLVDLRDAANPILVGTFDYAEHGLRGQVHMITTGVVAGREYAFVATQARGLPLYVFAIDGWNLTHVASYGFPVVNSAVLGVHDSALYFDPLLDGKPVLYVAMGELGWDAVDVSDPANPTRIGGSLHLDPYQGYTHTVRIEIVDGKRILATMMEAGVNTLRVFDATDLEKPVLLATWRADATRPLIPQHNIQLLDGKLYMAHYTEGFFVFDLGDVGGPLDVPGSLAPIAHWEVKEPGTPSTLGFANVVDLTLVNGVLFATDMTSGFHAVGFGCLEPGNVRESASR